MQYRYAYAVYVGIMKSSTNLNNILNIASSDHSDRDQFIYRLEFPPESTAHHIPPGTRFSRVQRPSHQTSTPDRRPIFFLHLQHLAGPTPPSPRLRPPSACLSCLAHPAFWLGSQ